MLPRGAGTIRRDMERLGILGGTFDPPHLAHLELAEAAREQFHLDRVLLVVAGDPWQKRDAVRADPSARLAMARAAITGHLGLEVSDVEIQREGPSYTVDTLEALSSLDRKLYLILGADAASGLATWHDPDGVRERATVLVADRPGADALAAELVESLRAEGWSCELLHLPPHDVSSTELRERLAHGDEVTGEVPGEVVRVVSERGLYTRPR